ncbi:MAG: SPFH domain-containing protein [Phycisphaerales bacterium]
MKGDHLSFARAAGVSLLGLGLQLALGFILLIYAALGRDSAAQSGAYLILAGGAVWLVLAIIFDQHRRERIEAMESESLDAASARESSVFGTTSDELRVAAKRLNSMHRVLVPTISLVFGLMLLGLAYWRYTVGIKAVPIDAFRLEEPTARGWAISIGVGIAVLGFIFGRFVSGMGQQKIWAPLKAGAAMAVGASLIGLALAVGHLLMIFKVDVVLRYLQVAIPVFIGVLGLEIILNFLLNLYRPRKPGEMPRPALESWLLGFIAAPDRLAKSLGGAITYQFGVDVTGSWLYQLLSRSMVTLAAFAVLVVWAMTCFSIVGPSEKGLRLRNGHLVEEVGPGAYFKLPWPFESIEKIPATQQHELALATRRPPAKLDAILWTNEHGIKPEEEKKIIVQPAKLAVGAVESADPVRDLALISVEVPVTYRITDLRKYEELAADGAGDDRDQLRKELLTSIAKRVMVSYLATLTESDLLGAQRTHAGTVLQQRVAEAFDKAGAGVQVLFVAIEGVHPPKDTADAFEKVVGNEQLRQERVEKARQDEIKTLTSAVGSVALARRIAAEIETLDRLRTQANLPGVTADAKANFVKDIIAQEQKIDALILEAGGTAGAKIAEARAARWETHMHRRGEAAAYDGRLAAYRASPTLYRASKYYEMLADLIEESRLYLVHDGVAPQLNIDLKDTGAGGDIFNPLNPNPTKN